MTKRILYVDGDMLACMNVSFLLQREGYVVVTAPDGITALTSALQSRFDLVLLEIDLPDCDGFDLARRMQAELAAPLVFVTARPQETDIVSGLELGAEDFITKPFKVRELLARIGVVLRRTDASRMVHSREALSVNDILLDLRTNEVCVRNQPVHLPPKEFELLHRLMTNAGQVLTNEYLLEAVWGSGFIRDVYLLYVHIRQLRERIEVDPNHPQLIQTVRGVGYRFAAQTPISGMDNAWPLKTTLS
jgi:DNA-binding response OmpR family regulator